jgi:hypothetical protein
VRKGAIALVAVALLAGALVAAVPILEERAAAEVKAAVESDGSAKVGKVEVGLFARRIVLEDLRFTDNGGGGSIKRAEGAGLAWPLGELLSGRTPLTGWHIGDPLRADRVELKDFDIADPIAGGRWSAHELTVEALDLARFDGRYNGQYPMAVLTARVLAALTMRRLEASNLMVGLPVTADTIGAAHLSLEHYDRGRIETLNLNGLEATAKDAPAPLYKVERITAGKLDWTRVLAAMSSAGWVPGAPMGRIHVDDFSISGFGGQMFSNYGISLKGITLQTEHLDDKGSRSRLRFEGFAYSPSLRGLQGLQGLFALQAMGLKEVKLDLDCAGDEDRQKGEMGFGPCKLVGVGLGEVEIGGRIVRADAPFWRAFDDGDLAALGESKAGLGSAKLVLADKSFLERALKALSLTTGRSVAETRDGLAQEIRNYQPPDVMISQDLTKFLDTLARFVEQGGTLTVDAKPEQPLDLGRLQALLRPGADVVGALGLTASVSR